MAKDDVLVHRLRRFFSDDDHLDRLVDVIGSSGALRRDGVSLRLLDWLCTSHAKSSDVRFTVPGSGAEPFHMYRSYQQEVKRYGKKRFDPFARRSRVTLRARGGETLHTSVGQMNFFRWAIENDVIQWVASNLRDLRRGPATAPAEPPAPPVPPGAPSHFIVRF